ncbi:MAG: hypothetical protein PVI81_04005 [Anaerolineales bacterium]|jgi:hypothetical protein
MKRIEIITLLAVLIAGCQASQPEPSSTSIAPTQVPEPTITVAPTIEPTQDEPMETTGIDPEFEITFDGEECFFTGSPEVQKGKHFVKVRNNSGHQGWMRICRGDDGYVWKDLINHDFRDDEDQDQDIEWPEWCRGFPRSSVASAASDFVIYEYVLRQEGLYFVIWEQNDPDAGWACGLITVEESTD